MKAGGGLQGLLRAVSRYVSFFLMVTFVITACLMLFISTLQRTLDYKFTQEDITAAAKLTMANVLLLSLVLTVIDAVWRRLTLHRPVKTIAEATERMVAGDFNVRIKPASPLLGDDTLDSVITCINKMAEELSGVETLRSDFIANVSHEMKTPLSVIQNYGTLLEQPGLPEQRRLEYARAITAASRRLADMMTNVLKLDRLENQQIYPSVTRFDLGEQLCESLLQYESVWEARGIEIDTDIAEGVYAEADAELLSLVWSNLLSNAFKFTERGGTVRLTLSCEGDLAAVRVQDTGCGMSAEVGAHIFEKFYQGDTSHATQGNGLGLALVRRVVDILHGEIGVESAVGVGTTFTVKIKRCTGESEQNS